MTHLNDISKVYLEQVSESAVPGKPAERLGAVTAIPKSEQEAAKERILAKTKAKRESQKPNDGNLANNYPPYDKITRGDVIAGRLGKDEMGGKKKKSKGVKEGFSNWRQDLSEVMDDIEANKEIKEKKVNNKIKINPEMKESFEELGCQLIEMVEIENFEGIFDELSDSDIFFLNDSLIEEVVEEVFFECLNEGYEIGEIENVLIESLEISSALLNEAKVTLGHDTKVKSDRLSKVKSAVKKVGKAVARGVGYAAGAAVRGAKAVKREFGKGYESGRGGSSSSTSSSSSTKSSSSSSEKGTNRPGLLGRIGSALKSGLKKAVAKGARAVSRGARNVARKMEGGETKKVEAPKAAPKKAEKPSDPWEGTATTPPKEKAKKAATPKAKAPADAPKRKRKASNLDSLLTSIRNEEVQQIDELSVNKMLAYTKKAEKNRESLNKKWDQGTATPKERKKVFDREEGETRASDKIEKKTGKRPYEMNAIDRLRAAIRKEETGLGEAVYGGTLAKKEKPKDTRYTVTAADKKGNTAAYQKYKAGDKKYKAAPHLGEENEIDEGMTMKDFKANRRKLKRREASADAKKRGHVGKEWYNSGQTYSTCLLYTSPSPRD